MSVHRLLAVIPLLLACTLAAADEPAGRKAYVILEITVHDPEMYGKYREAIAPVIARHGGRYLVRSGAKSFDKDPATRLVSPEGEWYPDRIIVLEFDSRAQLQAFVESAENKAIAPLRHGSATTRSVVVDGYRSEP
jgi:uncharacterized protein (DUF1330 family)